jgi:hypothetical protein
MTWAPPSAAAPCVPPGWYPDPEHAGYVRLWDGNAWTSQRAPAGGPMPASVDHTLDWVLPIHVDGCAIAAGYFGLFSLIPNPVTAPAAIFFGVRALRNIARSHKRGRGRAIFGLIAGSVSLGLFLLLVAVNVASGGN